LKKSMFLLAMVAVVTMLVAGSALASMHYQFYGRAHLSTDLQNNGDETSLFVSSNATRFGVKGKYETEYDAFTVVFQYESNANFNGEGDNTFSTRSSYAGLMGDWGRLIWGRHDTPLYTMGRSVDFFDSRIGELRNVTKYFGSGWDERPTSMIMYSTPLLGDAFKLNAQYVPEEGVDDSSLFSASGVYNKDGLMLGVGFEAHGKALEDAYDASDPDNILGESSTGLRAVASYKADAFRVAGLFQSLSNVGGFDGVSATTYGLGLSYKLDSGLEPKAQYYMMDPNTDVDDDGAGMLVVGMDLHLNKMATLYITYAMMMNEDNADHVPFRGAHGKSYGYGAAELGESPYGVSVGLIANW